MTVYPDKPYNKLKLTGINSVTLKELQSVTFEIPENMYVNSNNINAGV